ncbi:hypothetical protein [Pontibacterium sp.]|uniref:hypothetical protein n=1 Tax=Pontibacterium sp. TaxID=2036026 RepID=UPI0035689E57
MMKKTIMATVFSITVLSAVPFQAAAEEGSQANQLTPSVQEFDKRMTKAWENMNMMHEKMEKIRQAQTAQEQQKLLNEHWATMQNNMQIMHDLWEPGSGMGCCMRNQGKGSGVMKGGPMMGWGHMGGYYSKLTPEQVKQRQYMMDQYVPMQQMMMNHMMQHQKYMWSK